MAIKRTSIESLVKRDWSSEAYKKATDGKSAAEKEQIDKEWDNSLREYYLKDMVLTMVLDLFDALSELHGLLEFKPDGQ